MIARFFLVTVILALPAVAFGDISPSLWNYYKTISEYSESRHSTVFPGRCIGGFEETAEFIEKWQYRSSVYELHFSDRLLLGKTVYSLARYSGDISEEISRGRIANGVEGFHYSSRQICDWLNAVFSGKCEAPVAEEFYLISLLIRDNVVQVEKGRFLPSEKIGHVLAAAPGKKRTFKDNLCHERLHVLWDASREFRQRAESRWKAFTEEQQKSIRKSLKGYADNEALLMEEWAVREAQAGTLNPGM